MKMELQIAISKLENAFDTRKSDFVERLLAQEDTRLAHFVLPNDDDLLASIEQDMAHFRRTILEIERGGSITSYAPDGELEDAMSTLALPLLKSAIDKLHLALNRYEEKEWKSGHILDHKDEIISTSNLEQTLVDLAAVIEGDDDDMESFIAAHTTVLAKLLKTSIAALHDAMNSNNNEDDEEQVDPSYILQRLLLLDDASIRKSMAGGTVVAAGEDTNAMIASLLAGGGGSGVVEGQQIPLPILQIIQIIIQVVQILQCTLAVALRYVLIIPYLVFPPFILLPIFFTCLIWRPNDITCPKAVVKELFFFNPVAIYHNCHDSLPTIPIPGA
jgi:hypothetical protein